MVPNGLAYMRHMAGVTQARMAEEMGIPIRTFEDIEAGRSKYRAIHRAAGEMALIKIAAEKGEVSIIPMSLWETIGKAGKLVAPLLDEDGKCWTGGANKKPAS